MGCVPPVHAPDGVVALAGGGGPFLAEVRSFFFYLSVVFIGCALVHSSIFLSRGGFSAGGLLLLARGFGSSSRAGGRCL